MARKTPLTEKLDPVGIPQPLVEMATIGLYVGYKFMVYTEPLKNPSFHVRFKNDFELVLQIRDLKILEIKFNNTHNKFKKNDLPPGDILTDIKTFLGLQNTKGTDVSLTNTQAIWFAWSIIND
jgi:hypothetical protein